MNLTKHLPAFGICLLLLCGCGAMQEETTGSGAWHVESEEIVDFCAADFDIRYALCAKDGEFYVGYYDAAHYLKLAKRDSTGKWTYKVLPERANWDSHRYISLAVDRENGVHLSGNMHSDSLVYYRSEYPGDIASMHRASMTGIFEDSVTYPEFLQTDSILVFHYRNGYSGNGSSYLNVYDYDVREWEKLSLEPLFDGKGESNSYFKGPYACADGNYHMLWCWRDSSDCATNHGLYYAFSDDLKVWKSPGGYARRLPLSPLDDGFLVDDVKAGGGLINGGFVLGFDADDNPLVGYHKYDENDHTNLYIAMLEGDGWMPRRVTDWDWKWEFSGRGSIVFKLDMKGLWTDDGNCFLYFSKLVEDDDSPRNGSMTDWLLTYDPRDGSTVQMPYSDFPAAVDRPSRRGVLVHKEVQSGDCLDDGHVRYVLSYETRYPNRDKKKGRLRTRTASELRLVKTVRDR